ncbi:MAG: hypothetical protein EOL95_11715 [Bacteroidia bacterium]|nr:hypothetical protein [Bacteroidia bacterium]
MRHYQNTLTGEVVSEDEYSYAAAQKGNWVLYRKIPRYTIETPPYAAGRTEFDEDGKLCYWDDVKDVVRELEELKNAIRFAIQASEAYIKYPGGPCDDAHHKLWREYQNARRAVEEML